MVDDTGARTGADSGWAQRLRNLRQQQHDLLVGVVCPQAAAVLGRPSPEDIDPARAFQELGFDSVKASRLTGSKPSPSRIVTHPGL
jgi:mycoketide-CoA synthase